MLGRQGSRRTLLVLVLAVGLATAGCIGDEGEDVEPSSTNDTADPATANRSANATRLVDEAHGTLAMTAGVGAGPGPWLYFGGGEVALGVTEAVDRLTVYANLTDEGVNATAPGVGFVGVELVQGGEVHASQAEPGATSYTFEVEDPAAGDWSVRLTPIGADVNREVQVSMLAQG